MVKTRRKIKVPRLYGLTPAHVRQTMQDLGYVNRGYRIILAIDSHELFDYCFPVNPIYGRRQKDPEVLGESQAGLSHLFEAEGRERPIVILTPEYQDEVRDIIDGIKLKAPTVWEHVQTIDALIKMGDLEDVSEQEQRTMDEIVGNSFQFLLTVMLGIHSTGVNRMKKIMDSVLITDVSKAIYPEDRPRFEQIWNRYRKKHYDTIFRILEQESYKKDQDSRLSNQRDAQAIDRLIQLNVESEAAFRGGLLQHGYLFLYVSSAPRSERLFRHKDVRALLPRIFKRRFFSLLRNRRQILAYMVYHSRSDLPLSERALETRVEYRKLHRLLRRMEQLRDILESPKNKCDECVLIGNNPTSCVHRRVCLDIQMHADMIQDKKKKVINWGLFDQVTSYSHLLEADMPGLMRQQRASIFGWYMEVFRELLNSTLLKNTALERMRESHIWITHASDYMVSRQPNLGGATHPDLRTELDAVRGIYQYLPTQPRFDSAVYKEVIDLVLKRFRYPNKKELVEQIYQAFHSLSPDLAKHDDEYDLLCCYVYLVFPYEGPRTYEEIKRKLLPKKDKHKNDHIWQECLYVLCWSARRFGLFDDAEAFATEGISKFPSDPRFYHGWSLSVFARRLKNQPSEHAIEEAVAASERALDLYSAAANREQVAVCHNNTAYMLAYEVRHSNGKDLDQLVQKLAKARGNIEALKLILHKNEWSPDHPQFFHTEAFLTHQEVRKRLPELLPAEIKAKLLSAKEDINRALNLFECAQYEQLKNDVNNDYHLLVPEHDR